MSSTLLLAEMTREQVRALAPGATVVLPTGAIEQHGPHLPLQVDTATCVAVCERAAALASAEIPVCVAPALPFGYSRMNLPLPGVLTLEAATFAQVVRELGESLFRSGFRRIAILNGHRPNDELIRVAARELNERLPVSVAAASYWTIAWPALSELAAARTLRRLPGHAGAFETALTLALRPELVDRAALAGDVGDAPEQIAGRQVFDAAVFLVGQRMGDGPGYTDDPAAATAEEGQRYLDAIVRAVVAFLVAFHRQHPAETMPS